MITKLNWFADSSEHCDNICKLLHAFLMCFGLFHYLIYNIIILSKYLSYRYCIPWFTIILHFLYHWLTISLWFIGFKILPWRNSFTLRFWICLFWLNWWAWSGTESRLMWFFIFFIFIFNLLLLLILNKVAILF